MSEVIPQSKYRSLLNNGLHIMPTNRSKKTLCGRRVKQGDYYVEMPGDEPCPICEMEYWKNLNKSRVKQLFHKNERISTLTEEKSKMRLLVNELVEAAEESLCGTKIPCDMCKRVSKAIAAIEGLAHE